MSIHDRVVRELRDAMKVAIGQCTAQQQRMFRLMYSHDDLERPLGDVIDRMPEDKLDWAMKQIEGSAR